MDNNDLIGGLLVLAVIWLVGVGLICGAYKYGRYSERISLMTALQDALGGAYEDGVKDGRAVGLTKGWADGVRECDQEDLFVGHY